MLSSQAHHRLLDILDSLPVLHDAQARDFLLTGLPAPLLALIPRSNIQILDLTAILTTSAAWEPADSTAPAPFRQVLENACELAQGQKAELELRTLLRTL